MRFFDRTVHAEDADYQLVRYDRAGKWWVEPKYSGGLVPARRVSLAEAVQAAWTMSANGGYIHLRLPGDQSFDAAIRRSARERDKVS